MTRIAATVLIFATLAVASLAWLTYSRTMAERTVRVTYIPICIDSRCVK